MAHGENGIVLTLLKNIPAICMNVGPMLNGYVKNELAGSGMVVWKGREKYAAGEINTEQFVDYISRGYVVDVPICDRFSPYVQQNTVRRTLQHNGHGVDDERLG